MDFSNFVDNDKITDVISEQTFWVGDDSSVQVVVNLYEENGFYKMTSWLNGTEELNTIDYEGSVEDKLEILAAMEKLVHDNEAYIVDIASWNGE